MSAVEWPEFMPEVPPQDYEPSDPRPYAEESAAADITYPDEADQGKDQTEPETDQQALPHWYNQPTEPLGIPTVRSIREARNRPSQGAN